MAMAPELRMDLNGRAVVVVGLGRSGRAAAELALRLGAKVVATDRAEGTAFGGALTVLREHPNATLKTGGHDGVSFADADLIVVSPGVVEFDALRHAEASGVEVISEIELASRCIDRPLLAITGSNGKSTTTVLVGALLEAAGHTVLAGGNLGTPPSEVIATAQALPDVFVLEISSFQAERVPSMRPAGAALLNVCENHLDRYDGFDAYVRAKGNLFANQVEPDQAVVPHGDRLCIEQAKRGGAKIVTFGTSSEAPFWYDDDVIVDQERHLRFSRASMRLSGAHNAANVCAALALVQPWALTQSQIESVLEAVMPLPHRVAKVAEVDGVAYYDDSKGTNVGATVAAIGGLVAKSIVLIAGGRDKMGAYDALADAMERRGRAAVLIGEAAPRIAEALAGRCPVETAGSMEEAVGVARALAKPGDAVLLSPACSSFDMFTSYSARGDSFAQAVARLSDAITAS